MIYCVKTKTLGKCINQPKPHKNQYISSSSDSKPRLQTSLPVQVDPITCFDKTDLTCSKFEKLFSHSPWLTEATVMMVQEEPTGEMEVPHIEVSIPTETEDSDTDFTDQSDSESLLKKSVSTRNSSRENTPDKNVARRLSSVSWESGSEPDGDIDTDDSAISTSVKSSQVEQRRTRKAVWVKEEGEIYMDRGNTCKLSYMDVYMETSSALNLAQEISESITKHCDPANPGRLKIELKHGAASKLTDKKTMKKIPKKGKPSTKMSELVVDLDDQSDLGALIRNQMEKTSKAIREIFHLDADFDKCCLYKMGSPTHFLPYENSADEEGNSSPVIAILTVGLSSPRPMFLRTVTATQITHKVALMSGSLVVLSGKTETRYKRSIPKDYGTEEEQYYLVFSQRPPETDVLNNLKRSPENLGKKEVAMTSPTGKEETEEISSLSPPQATTGCNTEETTTPVMKSPPTVVRVQPALDNFQFQDSNDYETNGSLQLAATISAVCEKMDEETVTRELRKSHTSTTGTLNDKRKRLQNKMCLQLGELSSAAANNSLTHGMSFSNCVSPDNGDTEQIKETIESVSRAQTVIENTMKHIVEAIVDIKSDIVKIGETQAKEERPATAAPATSVELDLLMDELRKCNQKIDDLSSNKELLDATNLQIVKVNHLLRTTRTLKEDLKETNKALAYYKKNVVNILKESIKDLEGYHNSVFGDESRVQLQEMHEWMTTSVRDKLNEIHHYLIAPIISTETQTDEPNTPSESTEVDLITNPGPDDTINDNIRPPPSQTFSFSDIIRPSIKKLVESKRPVDLWLITDSIMRHVNTDDVKFQKYHINFRRIDKTASNSLLETGLMSDIGRNKPHIVYVHLGINDVQSGTGVREIVDNYTTFINAMERVSPESRIVVSCPLLNGNTFHDRLVFSLRHSLSLLANNLQEQSNDPTIKRIFLQKNNKFFVDSSSIRQQNTRYFSVNDRLHLSTTGKIAATSIMRDTVDTILKEFELRPWL